MTIRVLVVDDQALVRAGFRLILEAQPDIAVVGEAGLLVDLVSDPDQEIARAAEGTLQAIPLGSLQAFLARPDVYLWEKVRPLVAT